MLIYQRVSFLGVTVTPHLFHKRSTGALARHTMLGQTSGNASGLDKSARKMAIEAGD